MSSAECASYEKIQLRYVIRSTLEGRYKTITIIFDINTLKTTDKLNPIEAQQGTQTQYDDVDDAGVTAHLVRCCYRVHASVGSHCGRDVKENLIFLVRLLDLGKTEHSYHLK